MKFKITLLFALFTLILNAQNVYRVNGSGNVLENEKQISASEVRLRLANNPQALELFEDGRLKKTVGNFLLTAGFTSITLNFLRNLAVSNPKNFKNESTVTLNDPKIDGYSYTMYLIGTAAIIVAIPMKIGFRGKIKKSMEMLSEDQNKQKTTSIESTSIIANGNGIGVSITF